MLQPPLLAKMQTLMTTCVASGTVDRPDNTHNSANDPCTHVVACSECGADANPNCGWCQEEASASQLAQHGGDGFCSSACVTTADECGRLGNFGFFQ
eukprot:SAG11_NODE_1184_length_5591_cov_3.538420_5_plen_97_part_00